MTGNNAVSKQTSMAATASGVDTQVIQRVKANEAPQWDTAPKGLPHPMPQLPQEKNRITSALLMFLPMLYVAWADAELNTEQITIISAKIHAQQWLTDAEKSQLYRWLDPATPPTVAQFHLWLNTLRQVADAMEVSERQSLAQLGMEIARLGGLAHDERCATPEACTALAEIEEALGVISHEAIRNITPSVSGKRAAADSTRAESWDDIDRETMRKVAALTKLLDGAEAPMRNRVRALLSKPEFALEFIPHRDQYRDKVLAWSKRLAEEGLGSLTYPKAVGGEENFARYLAAMETLAHHDLSLLIKFGVQFGLFGSSIHMLGTAFHHQQYLPVISSLELPGAFAMTELGHGSNVRDLETIARYDPTTEQFIIHTPTESARKEYIGNAARHGQMATVFAQLEIEQERYGVHAFLVPLRDRAGKLLPRIRIEDNGEKMGLNGVDNGRIWFNHVRVPRTALLNRFATVTPEGHYESSIAGEAKRFFTMIGTLVAGRIGIAGAALSAAKSGITIAVRYAARRRQFGPPGQPERILLDYQTHQRRLMPLVANAYALDFAIKYLMQRYTERTEEDSREIETLAAALKAFSSWNTTQTLQTAREACGAQGYMAVNRIAALKADTDIFTTFEGDNTVLMQLVAKSCLTTFNRQFSNMTLMAMVQYLAAQSTQSVVIQNPLITRRTDASHLLSADFHLDAFRYREQRLVASVAKRLKARLDQGMDSDAALLECQSHLVAAGHAYTERIVLEQFVAAIAAVTDPMIHDTLEELRCLFALWHLEKHSAWYLEKGMIEPIKSKAIRRQVDNLCATLSRQAVALVDAFAIPEQCLAAPIATSALTEHATHR